MLPLSAVPAILVTGAALLVLVAGVAGAASTSQPGDLLYPARRPALMLQLALTNDPAHRASLEALLGMTASEQPAQNDLAPQTTTSEAGSTGGAGGAPSLQSDAAGSGLLVLPEGNSSVPTPVPFRRVTTTRFPPAETEATSQAGPACSPLPAVRTAVLKPPAAARDRAPTVAEAAA